MGAIVAERITIGEDITIRIVSPVKLRVAETRPVSTSITPFDEKGLDFLTVPFDLYETNSGFWKEKTTVIKLMLGFRLYRTIERARVFAGISRQQYYYFLEIHPHFSYILEDIAAARQADRLNRITGSSDWRAHAYLLEKEEGTEFSKENAIPVGGGRMRDVTEAILNAEGKVVMSRRAVELTRSHDNGNS